MNTKKKIKICGIRRIEDLKAIISLSIDYAGLIFTKRSKRYISIDEAKALLDNIDRKNTRIVGVFMDDDADYIMQAYNRLNLDYVQLHGQESPEFCNNLGINYIKVFTPNNAKNIEDYDCDIAIIDSPKDSDERYDWSILRYIITGKEVLIAGGINPDNVADALRLSGADGIDVASGVEISPGEKDINLIKQLVSIVRSF